MPETPTHLDPLADLREPDVAGLPGAAPEQTGQAPEEERPEAVVIRPMVDQKTQDEMVAEVVGAWHLDPTSVGFLHTGGHCGCRYIAAHALRVAVPVMTEEDAQERELEES